MSLFCNSSDKNTHSAILRLVSIFSEVPDDVLDEIAKVSTTQYFKQDQVIFNKGDMDFALYVIVTGKVKVHVDLGALIL